MQCLIQLNESSIFHDKAGEGRFAGLYFRLRHRAGTEVSLGL